MRNLILKFISVSIFFTLNTKLTFNKTLNDNKEYIEVSEKYKLIIYYANFDIYETNLNNIPNSLPFDTIGIWGISSKYNELRDYPHTRKHKGVDFFGLPGTNIKSTANGIVIFSGVKLGYGKVVIIQHNNDIITIYGHLNANLVKEKDIVEKGTIIGKLGNTGWSTGPHLHYEVRKNLKPINPMLFFMGNINTSYKELLNLSKKLTKFNCHGDKNNNLYINSF